MKCKNEVVNSINNIEYYIDKIKELIGKEEKSIDSIDDITRVEELVSCVHECCTGILLNVGVADAIESRR